MAEPKKSRHGVLQRWWENHFTGFDRREANGYKVWFFGFLEGQRARSTPRAGVPLRARSPSLLNLASDPPASAMDSSVRAVVVLAVVVVVGAGCSSGTGKKSADNSSSTSGSRVEQCVDRLMQRSQAGRTAQVERYARVTYCEPFAKRGWVYPDGTLKIDAHLFMEKGVTRSCVAGGSNGPTRTVPCAQFDPTGPLILDCALLHVVRRADVRKYLSGLPKGREVSCDDHTPLSKLGVA